MDVEKGVEVISYEVYDGEFIQIFPDSDFIHGTKSYESIDAYYDELEALSELSEIRINKELYNNLSHFHSPLEIALIGMDYTYTIASTKYLVDKEAIYTIDLNNPNEIPELYIYYGLSGNEDLKEAEYLVKMFAEGNLDQIHESAFKNPDVIAQLQDLRHQNETLEKGDISLIEVVLPGTKYETYETAFFKMSNNPYIVKTRNSQNAALESIYFRWYMWNGSNGKTGSNKRARGGTFAQYAYSWGGPWYNMGNHGNPIGWYHENGTADTVYPDAYIKLEARYKKGVQSTKTRTRVQRAKAWDVSIKDIDHHRRNDRWSYHSGNARENNINDSKDVMVNHKFESNQSE